jgi:hypothetical protein
MRKSVFILFPLLLLLAACGEAPHTEAKKKEPEKPPEPVTGRVAFHQMYMMAARAWGSDTQAMQLQSIAMQALPAKEGRYPAWRSTFVSEARRAAKSFTYSVVEGEGLYKGPFAGPDETYTGPRGQVSPFAIQAFKADSDAAYKVAMEKGAEYAKKHPDMPIHFLLENNKRFPNPTWRVIWGQSVGTSNFSIFIDATSGEYLQTMR